MIRMNTSLFADAFKDELSKIGKVIDVPSQQRLERGGWGPIESSGIQRGDMYGDAPKVQSREPSPVKPLEKRRRRAHPKR